MQVVEKNGFREIPRVRVVFPARSAGRMKVQVGSHVTCAVYGDEQFREHVYRSCYMVRILKEV